MKKLKWHDQRQRRVGDPGWRTYGSNLDVKGARNISVHNYVGHEDDEWFLTFDPFFDKYPLGSKTLEFAKAEALDMARERLRAALNSIEETT